MVPCLIAEGNGGEMPNPRTNPIPKRKGAPTGYRGPDRNTVNENTANWPGVPGKTQSNDRSAGVERIKQHPKSEGI